MVFKGNTWARDEVQGAYDEDKCVWKQSKEFYTLLKKQLDEENPRHPYIQYILMEYCYECFKCWE